MKIKKSQLEYLIRKNIKHVLNEDYDYDNPDPDEEEPEEIEEDPDIDFKNKISDNYNKMLLKNKNSNGLRQVPGSTLNFLKKGDNKVILKVYQNIIKQKDNYVDGIFPIIPMVILSYNPLKDYYFFCKSSNYKYKNNPNIKSNKFIDIDDNSILSYFKYPLFNLMKFGDLMMQSGLKTFDFYYTSLGFSIEQPYLIFSHNGEEPSAPNEKELNLVLYCIDKSFDYIHYPYINLFQQDDDNWLGNDYPKNIFYWQHYNDYKYYNHYNKSSDDMGDPYPRITSKFVQKFC